MSRVNTTLGGGLSDAATAFNSQGAGTDITSDWNPSNTGMYTSGAFAADGITPSTVVPAAIEYIQLRLGNTGSNATVYIELATAASGAGGYNNSVKTFNSTTTTSFQTGTAQGNSTSPNWAINCATTYYYGIYVTGGTTIYFARGGTTGNIYINGTLQNGVGGTAAWSNNRLSGQVSQRSIASAPGTPTTSSISPTSVTLSWAQPTDDGTALTAAWNNANVNGWRINYKKSTDSAWQPYSTGNVTATYNGTSTYSYTVTGLKPGTSYDFQVAALTDTTDAWNTDYSSITAVVGVRSGTATAKTLGGVYGAGVWNPIKNATYRAATNVAITSAVIGTGNPLVTCTVASTASLKTGDVVTITSSANPTYAWLVGTWTITVTSATTFTYTGISVSPGQSSTGTITAANREATIKVWNGSLWVPYY